MDVANRPLRPFEQLQEAMLLLGRSQHPTPLSWGDLPRALKAIADDLRPHIGLDGKVLDAKGARVLLVGLAAVAQMAAEDLGLLKDMATADDESPLPVYEEGDLFTPSDN